MLRSAHELGKTYAPPKGLAQRGAYRLAL